jgi:hypothetical protein
MGYTREQRESKAKALAEQNSQPQNKSQSPENINKTTDNVDKKKEVVVTKKLSIRNLPPSTTSVWVKNNTYSELIYVSKKTGFQTSWQGYGATQPITLEELIIMRNSQITFFENNWVCIDGFVDDEYEKAFSAEEILDYLQVKQYYKETLFLDNLDMIFSLEPSEIESKISKLSEGVKQNLIVRASDLIENGNIDNLKVIRILEKALNCKFEIE